MNTRTCLTLLLALMASNALWGQESKPIVELRPDEKIVYPERMGLPSSTSVNDVLNAFPENILTEAGELSDNYCLKVNGDTYELDPGIFLHQTQIGEVECIKIGKCATTGSQGIKGDIDVVLKQIPEGLHGLADVSVDTRGYVMPTARINYSKGRLATSFTAMYVHQHDKIETAEDFTYPQPHVLGRTVSNVDKEVLKFAVIYTLPHDLIKAQFTQQYSHTEKDSRTENYLPGHVFDSRTDGDDCDYGNLLTGKLTWEHYFNANNRLRFESQAEYNNTQNNIEWDYTSASNKGDVDYGYRYDPINRKLSLTLNYISQLTPKLKLEAEAQCKLARFDKQTDYFLKDQSVDEGIFNTNIEDFRIRRADNYAFIDFSWDFLPGWRLRAGERYQWSHYNCDASWAEAGSTPSQLQSGFITSAMVTGTLAPEHTVSAGYSYRLRLPSPSTIYPTYIYTNNSAVYINSNLDLHNEYYNIFNLGYAFNHRNISTSLDARYYQQSDRFTRQFLSEVDVTGYKVKFYKYLNQGDEDGLDLSGSFSWHTDRMSVLVGASYHQCRQDYDNSTRQRNWVFRFIPTMRLNHGVSLSMTALYTTPTETELSRIEKSVYISMRCAKDWKHWSIYSQWDNIGYRSELTTKPNDYEYQLSTDRNLQKLQVGASYKF